MRLGILGGSFDPPHVGHLLAATDAIEQLGLDRLTFVPAATQPLKAGRGAASAQHRLAMTQLLVGEDERFDVSTVEVDRQGLSFSVETLAHFASEFPSAERFFLVGADVLATLPQWREPRRVLSLARTVVLERSGERAALPPDLAEVGLVHLSTRRVDVSSTEIRERVRAGKSIRGFVTDGVDAYIARAGLYR